MAQSSSTFPHVSASLLLWLLNKYMYISSQMIISSTEKCEFSKKSKLKVILCWVQLLLLQVTFDQENNTVFFLDSGGRHQTNCSNSPQSFAYFRFVLRLVCTEESFSDTCLWNEPISSRVWYVVANYLKLQCRSISLCPLFFTSTNSKLI